MQHHRSGLNVNSDICTDCMAAVLLTGPNSRAILQQLTNNDLSAKALPWLGCQTIKIDSAQVRLLRDSYAGELGYELHMPGYQLLSIYQSLQRVGAEHGLREFGGYAFNSLRMEKAYRAGGNEFSEEFSGVEAGMELVIDTSREFIGAQNIRQRLAKPGSIRLAYLAFDDDIRCECFGNEAIYHEGALVGISTGGAFGLRVGFSLAVAFIRPELVAQDVKLQVMTSAGMRSAHVELNAVYDPTNQRLRS